MASAEKKRRHDDADLPPDDSDLPPDDSDLPPDDSDLPPDDTVPTFVPPALQPIVDCLQQGGNPIGNPGSFQCQLPTDASRVVLAPNPVSPNPVFIPTNNFDDHLDGILGKPVSSDDHHDVHPHKSDRHDDHHGHDHHDDDHHDKEWSKPSKSKKKGYGKHDKYDHHDYGYGGYGHGRHGHGGYGGKFGGYGGYGYGGKFGRYGGYGGKFGHGGYGYGGYGGYGHGYGYGGGYGFKGNYLGGYGGYGHHGKHGGYGKYGGYGHHGKFGGYGHHGKYGGYGPYGKHFYKSPYLAHTKYAIDDYLAKTHLLGDRRLSVSLKYLNTPPEVQYLNQYHGLKHPLSQTRIGGHFGLPYSPFHQTPYAQLWPGAQNAQTAQPAGVAAPRPLPASAAVPQPQPANAAFMQPQPANTAFMQPQAANAAFPQAQPASAAFPQCRNFRGVAPYMGPAIDMWCQNNCAVGNCPATHCMCDNAQPASMGYPQPQPSNVAPQPSAAPVHPRHPQPSEVPTHSQQPQPSVHAPPHPGMPSSVPQPAPNGNCKSVAPYQGAMMDAWCQNNCAVGNCPDTHCSCDNTETSTAPKH